MWQFWVCICFWTCGLSQRSETWCLFWLWWFVQVGVGGRFSVEAGVMMGGGLW